MRAGGPQLFIKLTTTPYGHHTLDTNVGESLSVRHDFEYVYIDQDPVTSTDSKIEKSVKGGSFAAQVFSRRAAKSRYAKMTLKGFLGSSVVLDDPEEDEWGDRSSRSWALLREYADDATLERADRLEPRAFRDQIGRKMRGALILRDAVSHLAGREEIDSYSGENMVIRCSDGNPRRLITLFNALLREMPIEDVAKRRRPSRLRGKAQTRVLRRIATSTLNRVQSEQTHGPGLHRLLVQIGEYMQAQLHKEKLATDQVSSVSIDSGVGASIRDLIKAAVSLGLLYPNLGRQDSDDIPRLDGVFHLGYVLAPHFDLLPRRGKARSLGLMLRKVFPLFDGSSDAL